MASLFKKLLTPDNLGKVLNFISDKKNQELFGKVLHTVKDIVPKKKKDEPKPTPQPAPQPVPQQRRPRRRPQYEDDYDDYDEDYEEEVYTPPPPRQRRKPRPKPAPAPAPAPAAEPKRRRRGKKPLWDIPGISPEDKAEIMRIVSETERVRQETDEQIRMLIPEYKQPKKPKPKPQPVRRERPTVDVDPRSRPPPAKRKPIPAPEPDVPDDEEEEVPPPPPPRDAPPPTPARDAPYQPMRQHITSYEPVPQRALPPPPPDEPAPEPPVEVQELSVPIAPAAPAPPRLQYPQKPQTLLDQIRQGAPLRHVTYSNPTPTYQQPGGVLTPALLQRRIRVAPSDDEDEYDDNDEWGSGKIRRARRRARGGAVWGV